MEVSEGAKKFGKGVGAVIVAIAIIWVLMWIWHNYLNPMPVGSITATQFGQLPVAAQGNYTMSPTTGYYLPKGTPIV